MSLQIDPDGFGFLVTDVARMMRAEMDRRIAEAGLELTAGEARTLLHAARAGSVRQHVLAERMGVEAMTASDYLDRLEGRGLIERAPDPADRRAKLVLLTLNAAQVLADIGRIGHALRADLRHAVPPGDWDRLNDLLKLMRSTLAQVRTTPLRDGDAS